MTRRALLAAVGFATVLVAGASARPAGAQQPMLEQDFPVAARRLARGTVLTAGDVIVARVSVRSSDAPAQPGWVTRRVIEQGEPLRAPAVAPKPMVSAGQPVRFVRQEQGIRLTVDGRAIHAGQLGDRISVRLGANRRVDGFVTGAGEVSASAPPTNP
jgi:flagella basal body P-ring formation protein FlgA